MLRRYGDAIRSYLPTLWADRPSRYQDFGDLQLAARLKTAAHRQACNMAIAARASGVALGIEPGRPIYIKNTAILDAKNVRIRLEPYCESKTFDLFVDIRGLNNEWLTLPCKATERLRYWLAKPDAKMVVGCQVYSDKLILWIDINEPALPPGEHELGLDLGVNKLITTSNGYKIGTDWREISKKLRRKKPGSIARRHAHLERDQFIRRCANLLFWGDLARIAIEDLIGLKFGKKHGRGKTFRKALAPWSYRLVRKAIEEKAAEYGVLCVAVSPRGTSRTCPSCGWESRLNRRDEDFLCTSCNHAGDADVVAAGNILSRGRTVPAWSRHATATSKC